jgi:glycosyltransferase involved in cell wall biosynthesis
LSERVAIVVPCFNEEARLDAEGLAQLLAARDVRLVFVDDGSKDGTREVLQRFAREHERVDVVALDENRGKAEAVRAGMLAASRHATIVGYLDADLATPPDEMLRIVDALRANKSLRAALGARVALLGANIDRKASRHYLGRVFATAASVVLGVRVYDTQCGAKAFRVDAKFADAIATPFSSRWVFDVELLDRLLDGDASRVVEVPLHRWRDVRGSKLGPGAMARAGFDLAKIAARRRS